MFKFIKVTEKMTWSEEKSLLLNTSCISHVQAGLNGKDTHIRMSDFKTYYFIKESVEEVREMINTDYSKAPVIMTAEEALRYYKNKDGV